MHSEYDVKFIIFISANYMHKDFSVSSKPKPETIHSHGFGQYMQFIYPAQNHVELAERRICQDLKKSNTKCITDGAMITGSGISPTYCFRMLASTPLLSISHSMRYNAQEHAEVGKVLRRYREDKCVLLSFSARANHNRHEIMMTMRNG